MAKLYLIKISDSKEILKGEGLSQRNVDIAILEGLLRLYGNKQNDFEKYFTLKETLDSLPEYDGDETEIKLDKEQWRFLVEGFKLTGGLEQRMHWDRLENGLYKQIHKPEEIDV